jgi:hypothetical protein
MVYMIQHQSAAFADGTPGDGMVWIAGDFYDFTVFNVQQDTTSRMAKAAITSANFAKGTPLLQKSEAFSLRDSKGEAVVGYCDPLILRRLGASGFPEG